MNLLGFTIALDELMFQKGKSLVHSLYKLILFDLLTIFLFLEDILQLEVFLILYS